MSRKNAWKKILIFPLRYYANCVSTTLTVLILHNVESVYFFYSNPVYMTSAHTTRYVKLHTNIYLELSLPAWLNLDMQFSTKISLSKFP